MSRLKMYLAMEDHAVGVDHTDAMAVDIPDVEPVTQEDVYEADAQLEESSAERLEEERGRDEDDALSDEIDERVEALESISDLLRQGLETHTYSSQFAAIVDQQLKPYQEMLGLETFELLIHDGGKL